MVALALAYSALAGFIYSLSFKPLGLWFLAPIAYASLISLLRKYPQTILITTLFGFISGLIVLSWSKTYVGVIPWIALAILQGLFLLPLGIVARFTRKVPFYIAIILLSEELQARFPFGGFSWRRIAFSQVDSPFAKLLPYIGMTGLSFITLTIAYVILTRRFSLIALFIALLISTPFITMPIESHEKIKVTAIQGGVPERGLDFNSRAYEVLERHIETTVENFSGDEDVILWPENAIDIDPIRDSVAKKKIADLQLLTGIPLIAGAIIEPDLLYNSTILFDAKGDISSIYQKRYLTPFGEFIPLRKLSELISPYAEQVTDFSTGSSLVIHEVDGRRIASVICYEILNDGLVREAASHSELLVVHTNSATFSGSSEGEQQMAITRLRAMESGRDIVTISTTGPSAFIDRRGVVNQRLSDGEVGALTGDVSLNNSQSLSIRLGGWLTLAVLLLSLIWAVQSLRKREEI